MPGADETEVVAVVAAGSRPSPRPRSALLGRGPGDPAGQPRVHRPRRSTTLLERLRPTHVVDGSEPPRPEPGGVPAPAGTAAIVVTSGTEGLPKGVELTRAGMEVMGRGYSAGLDAGPADRWLACLPLHHVASLGALARSYVTGVPCTVHDALRPRARRAVAARPKGTTIVSLVPTAMRRLLDAGAPLHEFRLRHHRRRAVPARAAGARRGRAASRVVDAYGLSETWGGFALDGVPIAAPRCGSRADDEILVRGRW